MRCGGGRGMIVITPAIGASAYLVLVVAFLLMVRNLRREDRDKHNSH